MEEAAPGTHQRPGTARPALSAPFRLPHRAVQAAGDQPSPLGAQDLPRRPTSRLPVPGWVLAGALYLAVAVAMWWPTWSGGFRSAMTCACGDPASIAWFMAWPAYAIEHGQNLLLATTAHVPTGMNMADNTSQLALGVVLAPVTWLLGPIASLNVALTAAPALTALSTYGSLRRALGLWGPAAFLAGLLFGFSPYMMRNEASTHLQTTFLALLPLIFLCSYELVVAQRGTWWHWGVALGLLITLQFFVGSEMLAISAVTAALAVAAAVLAALARKGTVAAKFPFAARGVLLAVSIAGVLLAYPLWFALAGPQHISGTDWWHPLGNKLMQMLLPTGRTAGQRSAWVKGGYLGPVGEFEGYLGIPALMALAVATAALRRPLARLCGAMTLIAVWLSLGVSTTPLAKGGEPSWLWLPWKAVGGLPVMNKITPADFSVVATWFIAIAAALLADQMWRAWSRHPAGPGSPLGISGATMARAGTAVLGLVLAVPWLFSWSVPFTTHTVRPPSWVTHAGAHLPAGSVVLFYPFPATYEDQALVWQAETGMRFAVAGGRGITAAPSGAAIHGWEPGTPEGTMSALSVRVVPHYGHLPLPPQPGPAEVAAFRRALRRWGVTDVVMLHGGRAPVYARRWLTTALGRPPLRQDGAWVWNGVRTLSP